MFLNLTAILQGNSAKSVRDSLCYSMLNSSSSPQETRARGRYNTTKPSDMSNARWIYGESFASRQSADTVYNTRNFIEIADGLGMFH